MTPEQTFAMLFGGQSEDSPQNVVIEERALTQIDKRDLSLLLAVLSSNTLAKELLDDYGVTLDKITDCFPDILF